MSPTARYTLFAVALAQLACGADRPTTEPIHDASDPGPEHDVSDPEAPVTGTVRYLKRQTSPEGAAGEQWTPAPRVRVEVQRVSPEGSVLAIGVTDDQGHYEIAVPPGTNLEEIRVVALAVVEGPRVNVAVHDTDTTLPPWQASAEGPGPPWDVDIEERYTAGAFNIARLAVLAGDALAEVVPDDVPPKLVVRWSALLMPACGSCFFEADYTLDIGGNAGEEDAHDDPVILHELGHYVEAAFGAYSNPGGLHDLHKVKPTLAWSEGFATWFQGVVRNDWRYFDLRPGGGVYLLDLESPPPVTKGVDGDGPDSRHSEALVYGLLWDMVDSGPDDDDDESWASMELMAAVVGLLEARDLNVPGSDLVDFLNDWRCAHAGPSEDAPLQTLLDAWEFPYATATETPECSPVP